MRTCYLCALKAHSGVDGSNPTECVSSQDRMSNVDRGRLGAGK